MPKIVKTIAFYFAVVLIVVIAVFPFYYAILTSFKFPGRLLADHV
jgi:trehalose/maltose transport system permease protein